MNYRETIRNIILDADAEAKVVAYRAKLLARGWSEESATNEAGLLRLSLQRAAYATKRAEQEAAEAAAKREELRNVTVATGFGLDKGLLREFGVAPVVADEDAEIKVSVLLLAEVNESRTALSTSSREMWQNIQRGEENPRLRTVWGVVQHPSHGLLAVTAAEFDALDLPEHVSA